MQVKRIIVGFFQKYSIDLQNYKNLQYVLQKSIKIYTQPT